MRKFLLVAMAVVMVMGISRPGKAYTTNEFLELCESEYPTRKTMCLGYLMGFVQGIETGNIGWTLGKQLCFPRAVSTGQLLRMFVKSANENPEELHVALPTFLYTVTARSFVQSTAKGG